MREFNVTGRCLKEKHYMVDISEKIRQIMVMIEKGQYFTINRARQYGKTTTLWALEEELVKQGYIAVRISFEGIGDTPFESEKKFCQNLLEQIYDELKWHKVKNASLWKTKSVVTFKKLDAFLSAACKNKKVVLMIDETDKTSNNLIFLRFLGMLRDKFLKRDREATFQSVILAGVYDVKNLKLKMVQAGTHKLQDGEKRINSPWNIAENFEIDISFSVPEIVAMLNEYEKEHKTGMDIEVISKEIRACTSGYPYLVSRLCKTIDEKFEKDWTSSGLQKAIKLIMLEQSTLFDDLFKNVKSNLELRDLLYSILINGRSFSFNANNSGMELGLLFGVLVQNGDKIAIHNPIFELRITNYFSTEKEIQESKLMMRTPVDAVTQGNKFNMKMFLEKFMKYYYEIYNNRDLNFLERESRLLFITYLRPFINGVGFYHIESETRNSERTDVIVDYNSEQFIIELKIWHGEQKHEKAYDQLVAYLNSKNKTEGYLLTFDFRKKRAKKPSAKWVRKSKKKIFDCLCV
ncbi:MAG: AAA-like domain-containing protein [Fibromonadales bacterium]|nr:AAA-like domain-containing protein [Fibromonadales bacterium]